jgi:zinc transporter ZupT
MRILLVSNVLTMNALGLCVILFLFSASGLLIRLYKGSNPRVFHWLIALGAGSMLSVSLVHILAETLEQTQFALYAFMAGFLAIYCIEELLTPHRQDKAHDGHTHEDPHEHSDHVALVTFGAIFLHTLFDGFGIRAGF